jgi:predicted transcriptional regulator
MNTAAETQKTALIQPLPDHQRLIDALSHSTRWKMLKELTAGNPRTIGELAAVGGCKYDSARKHLLVLKAAGLAVQAHGQLYSIPKHYLPTPGKPIVDFGHCVLRLDAAG